MISLFNVFMNQNTELVNQVLHSGMITQASKVEAFESQLKEWFNYPYILTLNSATSGLTLALRLLNLPKGSEVLSTPLTCFATNAAILANDLKIKWIDVDETTCNISLEDLKNKISENTRAVVFVHWGGYPVNVRKVQEICDQAEQEFGNTISIVEDCAHAFGAEIDGRKVGTFGNYSVFSLQAIKHLTTGDGGLIFLPDRESYERAKLLRWYGIDRDHRNKKDFRLENDVVEWGYKFHMNDINASIGLSNLPFINDNLKKIRENVLKYKEQLSNLEHVKLLTENEQFTSSYWIYTIKVDNKEQFIQYMKYRGIQVSQVHNRNDGYTCLKEFRQELPNLDELEKKIVCIPCGWWLSLENVDHIIHAVKEWDVYCNCKFRLLNENDHYSYQCLLQQLNNKQYFLSKDVFQERLFIIYNLQSRIIVLENQETNELLATARITPVPTFQDSIGQIDHVVVNKNHQRKGFGSYIIQYVLDRYTDNCYKVILSSKDEFENFYNKNGFVKEGVEWCLRKKN